MITILFTNKALETAGIVLVDETDGNIIRHAVESQDYTRAFIMPEAKELFTGESNLSANAACEAAISLMKAEKEAAELQAQQPWATWTVQVCPSCGASRVIDMSSSGLDTWAQRGDSVCYQCRE